MADEIHQNGAIDTPPRTRSAAVQKNRFNQFLRMAYALPSLVAMSRGGEPVDSDGDDGFGELMQFCELFLADEIIKPSIADETHR